MIARDVENLGCVRFVNPGTSIFTMAAQALVWRANVKTEPPDEGIDPYQFCLERSIYGIGWAVEGLQTTPDWSSYLDLAATIYETSQTGARSWHNGAMFIKSSIRPNDLIWIRDYTGTFWLGRIDGEWEYSSGRLVGADVVDARVCRWVKVPVDDVCPALWLFVAGCSERSLMAACAIFEALVQPIK